MNKTQALIAFLVVVAAFLGVPWLGKFMRWYTTWVANL